MNVFDDIKQLAGLIKDNWSLCEFLGKSEKEYMVAETIHAAVINLNQHGEPFSFKGNIRDDRGGVFENTASYADLLREGLFREEKREIDGKERVVIFPTPLLIEKLKWFFKLPPYSTEVAW